MLFYFIQNTESVFFQSDQFAKILNYINEFPVNTKMKQTDQYLILEFKHIDKLKVAKDKLEHICQFKKK